MELGESPMNLGYREVFHHAQVVHAVEGGIGNRNLENAAMDEPFAPRLALPVHAERLPRNIQRGDAKCLRNVGIHLAASASGVQDFRVWSKVLSGEVIETGLDDELAVTCGD